MGRQEEASKGASSGHESRAHLELEMRLGAEPIAGSLSLPVIERHWDFQGWVALAGALEAALQEALDAERQGDSGRAH